MKKTVEKTKSEDRESGENSATLFESVETGRAMQDGGVAAAIAKKTAYTANQVRTMSNEKIKSLLEDVADRNLDLSPGVKVDSLFKKKSDLEKQEQQKVKNRSLSR
ncbi:hypothetical protein [Microbulbifer aggregans]|uniref:hypothetical protein n=1 Tax=Microbulbifer aggregans TaxID=1769779 RepID=UPI001CFCFEDB|nr:hypothetical protein [Microbulbifer aggregans]